MKNTILTIGLVLATSIAWGGELPDRASEYLDKLKEYELSRVKEAKSDIWQKRLAVAVALKRELVTATKSGDLETANALKVEIDRLAGEVDLAAIKAPAPPVKKNDVEKALKERFVGKTWRAYGYGYKFERNGEVVRITLEGADKGKESAGREWKIVSPDTVAVTSSGATRLFIFSSPKEGTTKKEGDTDSGPITLIE